MEPIISLTYIVTIFFGYYVGADMYNYFTFKNEFREVKDKLDSITSSLNQLDNTISSKLNRIDRKLD
jgi:hypothetical protein